MKNNSIFCSSQSEFYIIDMESYLKKLIAEGENQQLDFKYCISDSRKIARTLSAFANTDGGRILNWSKG